MENNKFKTIVLEFSLILSLGNKYKQKCRTLNIVEWLFTQVQAEDEPKKPVLGLGLAWLGLAGQGYCSCHHPIYMPRIYFSFSPLCIIKAYRETCVKIDARQRALKKKNNKNDGLMSFELVSELSKVKVLPWYALMMTKILLSQSSMLLLDGIFR